MSPLPEGPCIQPHNSGQGQTEQAPQHQGGRGHPVLLKTPCAPGGTPTPTAHGVPCAYRAPLPPALLLMDELSVDFHRRDPVPQKACLEEESFILAHGFRDFSPWLVVSGLRGGRASWHWKAAPVPAASKQKRCGTQPERKRPGLSQPPRSRSRDLSLPFGLTSCLHWHPQMPAKCDPLTGSSHLMLLEPP